MSSPENCSGNGCPPIKQVNNSYTNEGLTPEQLVQNNQRLVHAQAQYFVRRGLLKEWEHEEYKDLIGAGNLGLCRAAKRYQAGTGYRFSSLAVPWIRGSMLHYLRDRGRGFRVPRVWSDWYMKGYGLPDADAAAKIGITVELWQEVRETCGIWMKDWDPVNDHSSPEIIGGFSREPELEESPHLDRAKVLIRDWLRSLPESDRELVEAVYFRGEARKANKKRLLAILATMPKLTNEGFGEL